MKNSHLSYGINSVQMLLKQNPSSIQKIYLLKTRQDKSFQVMADLMKKNHVPNKFVDKRELDKLSEGENHQGVVAELKAKAELTEKSLLDLAKSAEHNLLILILDGVTDPHNLGAILRSANAFNVDAVVAPKDRACGLTPVVRKVACGAADFTPLVQVTNLARTMEALQQVGVWIVGMAAETDSTLTETDLKGNVAIALGAEGSGLRRLTKEKCDYLAKIPMGGLVESLNVSVATGIALYEVSRQRG